MKLTSIKTYLFLFFVISGLFVSGQSLQQELVLQSFHSGYNITDVAIDPAASKCVTIGDDNQMLFFDLSRRHVYKRVTLAANTVAKHLAIDTLTQKVISLEIQSGNPFLIYRDLKDGEITNKRDLKILLDSLQLAQLDDYFMEVSLKENTLILLTKDSQRFILLNLHTGNFKNLTAGLSLPNGQVNGFVIDGETLVVASTPGAVHEINLKTGGIKELWKTGDPNEGIANIKMGGNFLWILTDKKLMAMDKASKTTNRSFALEEPGQTFMLTRNHPLAADNNGNAYYYNRDSEKLIIYSADGTKKIADAPDAYISHKLRFASMKEYLVIAEGNQLSILDTRQNKKIFGIYNNWQSLTNWHFFNPGVAYVSAGENSFLKVDLARAFISRQELPGYLPGGQHELIDLPKTKLKAINNGIAVKFIDAATGEFRFEISNDKAILTESYDRELEFGSTRGFKNVFFSGDEKIMVGIKPLSCQVLIWDLENKKLLREIDLSPTNKITTQIIDHLDFHAGEKLLYAETSNNNMGNVEAIIVDVQTGKILSRESVEFGYGLKGAFFPHQKKVIIPGELYNENRLLDLTTKTFTPLPAMENPTVSDDEKIIFFIHKDSILSYQSDTKFIKAIGQHNGVRSLVLDKKTGFLVSADGNRMIKIWSTEKQTLLFTLLIQVPENAAQDPSYVFISPDNFYSGGGNISQFFVLNTSGHTLPFEQSDRLYNRPDKILASASKANPKLIEQLQNIAQKRAAKNTQSPVKFAAEIMDKNYFPISTKQTLMPLHFRVTDAKQKIASYQVWLNGISLFHTNDKLPGKPTAKTEIKENIILTEATNRIEVAFWDANGNESFHDLMVIDLQQPPKPVLWMIGLGASKYQDSTYDLKFAAKDVADIERFLKTASSFSTVKTLFLKDKEITRSSLQQVSKFLNNTAPEDMVLLYYAGHGLLDKQYDYFLASYDIDFAEPALKGISVEQIETILTETKARKKVVVIDACHSGLLEDPNELLSANVAGEKNVTQTGRGLIVLKDQNKQIDAEVLQGAFMTINRGEGITIIAASGGQELAYEDKQYQNGLFTYSFLEGIKSGNADLDKDKSITLTEMKSYVEKRVLNLSNGKQRPTNRRWNNYFDFPIWSVQDKAVKQLFNAVTKNDTTLIKKMLSEGYEKDMVDEETGMQPVHIAARDNAVNALKLLLQHGVSINVKSKFGWTPLFLAVSNNNVQAAYILIVSGATVKGEEFFTDNKGKQSLQQIALGNKNEHLAYLLNHAEELRINEPVYRQMLNAIINHNIQMLDSIYMAKKPTLDFVLPDVGASLIYFAIGSGNADITSYLMSKGASINNVRFTSISPLHIAAYYGKEEIIKLLLSAGADKQVTDANGKRPLDYLQSNNENLKTLLQ